MQKVMEGVAMFLFIVIVVGIVLGIGFVMFLRALFNGALF